MGDLMLFCALFRRRANPQSDSLGASLLSAIHLPLTLRVVIRRKERGETYESRRPPA